MMRRIVQSCSEVRAHSHVAISSLVLGLGQISLIRQRRLLLKFKDMRILSQNKLTIREWAQARVSWYSQSPKNLL